MLRILWFLVFLRGGHSAGILALFPWGFVSHQLVFQPIVSELLSHGHHVTMYTSLPMKAHPNLKTVLVPDFASDFFATKASMGVIELGRQSPFNYFKFVQGELGVSLLDKTLRAPAVQELLKSNNTYDLVLHESFFFQHSIAAILHKFKAPAIAVATFGDYSWIREMSGAPPNPAFMVDFRATFTDRMTFMERLHSTYLTWMTLSMGYYYTMTEMESLAHQHVRYPGWESRPPLTQLLSDQALILVNSHHSTGSSSPTAPHLKEIGGIHIVQPKPLPKDLDDFIKGAEHGVIYFSLGSIVALSDPNFVTIRAAFEKTFAKMKQRVIWKYAEAGPPVETEKLKIVKWAPQLDILARDEVKLFITHGGYLSLCEAINFAKPILGIPIFADQPKNLKFLERSGYGIHITPDNVTETSLTWAINLILNDSKFKIEAERRSKLFHDRPMKPTDEAVYWIEYVLRHGKVLQPASVHMRFYQVYCLDIIAAILLAVTILYIAVKVTVKCVLCQVSSRRRCHTMVANSLKKSQ